MARPMENHTSPATASNESQSIQEKDNYAKVIQTNSTPIPNKKYGNSNVKALYANHDGKTAVIFETREFYGVMEDECKLTLVGKFIKTRPQIDKISEKITVQGKVQIGVFDYRTVFLDFDNEDDCKTVWYKRLIEIEGHVMWLEKWSPDFKLEEDSPVVPIWVLLPELPFHCHSWHYIKQIVAPLGTPLMMDLATENRTRPSMAKVRVEINLTKPKMNSIWIGTEDKSCPRKGFTQKSEYENPPKFCTNCKILGHSILQCRRVDQKKNEEKEVTGNSQSDKTETNEKGTK
ncbi:uncharacterized protein LOC132613748 [Lycium barbarum]|uniref:uncharacterized protein LOC132613748 n=1 Tax=Lycium barbarum TaxID=112863 RepID=UPI00293EF81F|nr:uncharacterized protein LOC132613748 [Lycium barbarum]